MFGLPSSTEVSQRLPKEAFYRNMNVSRREKDLMVSDVERITVVNVVSPRTANLQDGHRVHEILVIDITPRDGEVPDDVLALINRANHSRMVLYDDGASTLSVIVRGGKYKGGVPEDGLELRGRNLDEAWESLVSQVVFCDPDGTDLELRLQRKKELDRLLKEREQLNRTMRKERQIVRRNELYDQYRAVCKQVQELQRRISSKNDTKGTERGEG